MINSTTISDKITAGETAATEKNSSKDTRQKRMEKLRAVSGAIATTVNSQPPLGNTTRLNLYPQSEPSKSETLLYTQAPKHVISEPPPNASLYRSL